MSVKERKKQTKHISEGWEKCRGAFGVLKRLYAEDFKIREEIISLASE